MGAMNKTKQLRTVDRPAPSQSKTAEPKRSRPKASRQESAAVNKNTRLPIVGVGASAGGLEAFQELLRELPADTGMSFVLLQHLDPQHPSALTELLAGVASMPVQEATQNCRVLPNRVYVIPPNVRMVIEDKTLRLTPRISGSSHTIDFFFESLAAAHGERAVGVVLSGNANDGTLGLEAIKAAGGVTLAQDESARYDSMPRSAAAAGCVDFVLPPGKIAAELVRIARHPFVSGPSGQLPAEAEREYDQELLPGQPLASGGHGTPRTGARQAKAEAAAGSEPKSADFQKVLALLRTHSGVDFSLYKSATIRRRILRRVVINRHSTLETYATFLRGNDKELDALYSDVLISVTSFFRNPDAFEILRKRAFPKLLEERDRDNPVRIWVLGCSTGQEAYSLAMTYAEATTAMESPPRLQIFATDLNETLLDKARAGLYARTVLQDVSPDRLRRFFVEEHGGFRVVKALREQVVFARQNVATDPPFSRLDLISCRNLMIYLEPDLQKRLIANFHYALKPGGVLVLGASESVGDFTDLFAPLAKKQKIFTRKNAASPYRLPPVPGSHAAIVRPRTARPALRQPALPQGARQELDGQREADRFSVARFAPPAVLVNEEGQILQFRGLTEEFLRPATGKASFDLLKMARDGLVLPLRTALVKARRDNRAVRREGIRFEGERDGNSLAIEVIPLRHLTERVYLVLFDLNGSTPERRPKQAAFVTPREAPGRIAELETELAESRDYLQAMQEKNESSYEELQAAAEEAQSANEELQSVNEELETSKEELESSNEELTTINDEMAARNAELSRLNADLNNLQGSLNTAILLLGSDYTIRRFSAEAQRLFNLLPTDIGRPLAGIRHNLELAGLDRILSQAMTTASRQEKEVRDQHGRWLLLRASPYFSSENRVEGVVLMLTDIDAVKRTARDLSAARDYAVAVAATIPVPFLVLSSDLRVKTASGSFYRKFETTAQQTEGRLIYELGSGQWNVPELRRLLEQILPEKSRFTDFEISADFPGLGPRVILVTGRRIDSAEDVPESILLAMEDITERRKSENYLRDSSEELTRVSQAKDNFIAALSHELRTPLTPVLMAAAALREDKRLPDDVREQLAMMEKNITLEARFIDDLLDLTAISRGKIQLRLEPCDAHSLIAHAIEIVRPDALAKDIKITCELSAEHSEISADGARFEQVVWNLLRNAVKFTPAAGRIIVRTTNECAQPDQECLHLEVRDTGRGIDASALETIFQPFDQGSLPGGHHFGGVGLGLAIARAVVAAHGGSIKAESAGKDAGATFVAEFPARSPQRGIRNSRPPLPDPVTAKSEVTLRLLVVEDHASTLQLMVMLLRKRGHEVVPATTVADALAAAEKQVFDLVISDLGLPDGTGLELMGELRTRHGLRGVVLSGYGMEQDIVRSQDAGFISHLVKPIRMEDLFRILTTVPRRK